MVRNANSCSKPPAPPMLRADCRKRLLRWLGMALAILTLTGCASVPSNNRDWSPDMAQVAQAEFHDDAVTVRNVRNCVYFSTDEYVVNYDNRTYNLNELATVDFFVVPLVGVTPLAHTMMSFGFDNGEHLAVSVEIRRENGEQYQFLNGSFNQYELMYVVADERDVVKLRTNFRGDDVYMYRAKATREQVRELFVDVMQRVNHLAAEPEFYNTFTNNSTTNIVDHINRLAPGKVPYGFGVLFPGYSDKLAYRLGLIDNSVPCEELRRRSNISPAARQVASSADYSDVIRR